MEDINLEETTQEETVPETAPETGGKKPSRKRGGRGGGFNATYLQNATGEAREEDIFAGGTAIRTSPKPVLEQTSVLQVQEVPIERILDSPFQTREKTSDAKFAQIVHSIKTLGFRGILLVRKHSKREGYYEIIMGGHTRRDAAKEAGLSVLPIVIVSSDDDETGLSTALENLGREDLNIVEEGKLYLLLRAKYNNCSQEELAQRLGLDITRNRIKEAEAAAKDAPDIQAMLIQKGGGGIRAAKYLRQLNVLDEGEEGRAARERAPIIADFQQETLSTDGVNGAVQEVFRKVERERQAREIAATINVPQVPPIPPTPMVREEPVKINVSRGEIEAHEPEEGPVQDPLESVIPQVLADAPVLATPVEASVTPLPLVAPAPKIVPEPRSHGEIEREQTLDAVLKRFEQFKRQLGENPPTAEERRRLYGLTDDVQTMLQRQVETPVS